MDRGQRNELCSHRAPVENLERHDRANGVAVAAVLNVEVHTERTTRTGVEVPRVVVGVLRRRPNAIIGIRGTKSYFFTSGSGDAGVDFGEIDGIIKVV